MRAFAMRLDIKFSSLWRFFRAKAARVNRVLSDAGDDDMVFQVHPWEKKLLEQKETRASSSGHPDEGAK
jgi:hypothetical protein